MKLRRKVYDDSKVVSFLNLTSNQKHKVALKATGVVNLPLLCRKVVPGTNTGISPNRCTLGTAEIYSDHRIALRDYEGEETPRTAVAVLYTRGPKNHSRGSVEPPLSITYILGPFKPECYSLNPKPLTPNLEPKP